MTPQPLLPALDAFRAHLTDHDLPEVVAVTVSSQGAAVQVAHNSDAEAIRNLLAWAQDLSAVQATVWRPFASPYALHVTVRGRTGSGLAVEVFASIDYDPAGLGAGLEPAARIDLTLDELRGLASGASCD
jgi:hypothetical protein